MKSDHKSKKLQSWTVHQRETAFGTTRFTITKEQMTTPAGVAAEYFIHHGADAALCVCVDGDKVLVERQYRPPIGRVSADYPAGAVEPSDNSPEDAAKRELAEETGYSPVAIEHLATLDRDPGFSSSKIHVFLARGTRTAEASLDETEEIDTKWMPRKEVLGLIESGEMGCAFCVASTLLAFSRLGWISPSSR